MILKLPGPGHMLAYYEPEVGTIYAEVIRVRNVGGMSAWGPIEADLWDLKCFKEDDSPFFVTIEELELESMLTANELSRQYRKQRSERIVTFEDGDGYSFVKTFKEY